MDAQIDRCNVLDFQKGYRKWARSMGSIFILWTVVDKYMDVKTGRFYCAFTDFEKFFDNSYRSALWSKLFSKGLSLRIAALEKFIMVLNFVWNVDLKRWWKTFEHGGVKTRMPTKFVFRLFNINIVKMAIQS